MTPETLTALLLVVCLLGLMGLGVAFYLVRRRFEERLEDKGELLNSLDERTIHQFANLDKKTQDILVRLDRLGGDLETYLDKELEKERELRESSVSDLNRELKELDGKQAGLQAKVETEILEGLRGELTEVKGVQQSESESVGKYREEVDRVRLRNDTQLALSLLRSGEAQEAARILQSVIEEDPENRENHLFAAQAYEQAGDSARAAEVLTEGLSRFDNDPDFLAKLARLCCGREEKTEQARLIAEGLVRHPDHPKLLFERALCHIATKNFEAAKEDLVRVLDQGVETSEIRYNLGIAEVSLGQVRAGISELRKAIALNPMSEEGNHALGLALLEFHRFQEAVDFLERARELKPDSVAVRLDLAAAMRLGGSPGKSLKESAVARELDPKDHRALLEQALAYHSLSEFGKSLDCLDTLLSLKPDHLKGRTLKAEILAEIDRTEESLEEWKTLNEQFPADPRIKLALGDSLKNLGQADAALAWYEMAARMAPEEGEIQVRYVREALSQNKLEEARVVIDSSYSKSSRPQERLLLLEGRLLLILKQRRYSLLDKVLKDLKDDLDKHPEAIPLDHEDEFDGEDLLRLGLGGEDRKMHNALVDLLRGDLDYDTFDEIVTKAMLSMLPPTPSPRPPQPLTPQETVLREHPDNGREREPEPPASAPPTPPESEPVASSDSPETPQDEAEDSQPPPPPVEEPTEEAPVVEEAVAEKISEPEPSPEPPLETAETPDEGATESSTPPVEEETPVKAEPTEAAPEADAEETPVAEEPAVEVEAASDPGEPPKKAKAKTAKKKTAAKKGRKRKPAAKKSGRKKRG